MEHYEELLSLIENARSCLVYVHRQSSMLDGYGDIQRTTEWMIDKIDGTIATLYSSNQKHDGEDLKSRTIHE